MRGKAGRGNAEANEEGERRARVVWDFPDCTPGPNGRKRKRRRARPRDDGRLVDAAPGRIAIGTEKTADTAIEKRHGGVGVTQPYRVMTPPCQIAKCQTGEEKPTPRETAATTKKQHEPNGPPDRIREVAPLGKDNHSSILQFCKSKRYFPKPIRRQGKSQTTRASFRFLSYAENRSIRMFCFRFFSGHIGVHRGRVRTGPDGPDGFRRAGACRRDGPVEWGTVLGHRGLGMSRMANVAYGRPIRTTRWSKPDRPRWENEGEKPRGWTGISMKSRAGGVVRDFPGIFHSPIRCRLPSSIRTRPIGKSKSTRVVSSLSRLYQLLRKPASSEGNPRPPV